MACIGFERACEHPKADPLSHQVWPLQTRPETYSTLWQHGVWQFLILNHTDGASTQKHAITSNAHASLLVNAGGTGYAASRATQNYSPHESMKNVVSFDHHHISPGECQA